MSIQKKYEQALVDIRALTLTRDKQRSELAHAAREIVTLRLQLATVKKLACDAAGDPAELLSKIAKMFEVEQ